MRGGELVDDVQRRLVVGVSDVHVDSGLQATIRLMEEPASLVEELILMLTCWKG